MIVFAGEPLNNAELMEKPIGIIVINTDGMDLLDQIEYSNMYSITLTNNTGGLIHHNDTDRVWGFEFGKKDGFLEEFPDIWNSLKVMDPLSTRQVNDEDHIHLISKIPIHSAKNDDFLGLVMTARNENILYSSNVLRFQIFIVSIAAVLVVGLISAFLVYQLTKPIKTLRNQVQNYSEGDEQIILSISGNDEISMLSRAFLNLIEKLQLRTNELKIKNRTLRSEATQRRAVEKELRIAMHNAESANIAKSNFLSSMSHELRTPLNAISGFSQILNGEFDGKLNEKQKKYVKDILSSSEQLSGLINDVLDISKIEEGGITLNLEIVDITNLVKKSMLIIKDRCYKHNISLNYNIDESLKNSDITADGRKINQIMYNLLTNAVKFTPDYGEISVNAVKNEKMLEISVSDNGIGIEQEDTEMIFHKFYQKEGGIINKTKGAGLGLNITKNLVEMHRGFIEVKSDGKDKGATFIFTIPLNQNQN